VRRSVLSDAGSIAPLVAGYLALVVMVSLMATNVIAAMAMSHKVQGVADAAVVYAHERSLRVGIPMSARLNQQLGDFLSSAPSATRLNLVSAKIQVQGASSILVLCSRFQLPLSQESVTICKEAKAQSYLIPLT
jgi:hypothetical protein